MFLIKSKITAHIFCLIIYFASWANINTIIWMELLGSFRSGNRSRSWCFKTFQSRSRSLNHIRTYVHGHAQLSLKCRPPNRINFDIFDRCFCKVETRACETLCSCTMRLRGLVVTTFPSTSRSFNSALCLFVTDQQIDYFSLKWNGSKV